MHFPGCNDLSDADDQIMEIENVKSNDFKKNLILSQWEIIIFL